jgi:hypothetical protein
MFLELIGTDDKKQNRGKTDQFDFLRGIDKMMNLIDLSIFLTV